MKSDFRLRGLNKSKTATLELIDTDRTTFWAKIDMPKERFNALWDYCKGNWKEPKIAEIEHDGFNDDGTPHKPIMTGFREWDLSIIPV